MGRTNRGSFGSNRKRKLNEDDEDGNNSNNNETRRPRGREERQRFERIDMDLLRAMVTGATGVGDEDGASVTASITRISSNSFAAVDMSGEISEGGATPCCHGSIGNEDSYC